MSSHEQRLQARIRSSACTARYPTRVILPLRASSLLAMKPSKLIPKMLFRVYAYPVIVQSDLSTYEFYIVESILDEESKIDT